MYFIVSSDTLTLCGVNKKLGFTDNRSSLNWLKEHNVPITKRGREKVVFSFIFEFQLQLEIIEQLKIIEPYRWSEIYLSAQDDISMLNAVFQIHQPSQIKTKQKSKIKKFF